MNSGNDSILSSGVGGERVRIQRSPSVGHAALPLALTAILLLYPGATLPLVQFEVGGMSQTFAILQGLTDLQSEGLQLIAVFMGWVCLGATLFKNAMIVAWCLFENRERPGTAAATRSLRLVAVWEAHEVLALGIIICLVNLSDIGTTSLSGGFYLLLVLFWISLLASTAFEKGELHRIRKKGKVPIGPVESSQLNRGWALILTGFLLYMPANIYPVATFTLNGVTDTRTILGGVSILVQEGNPILAIIVFVASVAVPLLKLAGLAVLMVSVQYSWIRGKGPEVTCTASSGLLGAGLCWTFLSL